MVNTPRTMGRVISRPTAHSLTSRYVAPPWNDIASAGLFTPCGANPLCEELRSTHYASPAATTRETGISEIERIAPALIRRHRKSLSELAGL